MAPHSLSLDRCASLHEWSGHKVLFASPFRPADVTFTPAFLLPMPLRIFIVEDNVETLNAVKAFLERRGHEVVGVTLMEEALVRLLAESWDVLIADIGLPDGDGWELMRRLQKHPPRFSVAMSGYGTPADIAHSKSVGFHLHLVKPFKFAQIDAVLAEAQESLGVV